MERHKLGTGGLVAFFLVICLAVIVIAAGCTPAKKEKTATLAWGQWMGGWYSLYVTKLLLEEEFGYTTKIEELSVPGIWAAIAAGDVDVFPNSWIPNQADLRDQYAGQVEVLGALFEEGIQGFLVDSSTADEYGLTSLEDLKDPEIARVLDSDGDGKGDLLGCSAAWKCAAINDTILEEAGLSDLYQQQYGEEAFIRAAIEGALRKGDPVLFYGWLPHELFVEFPFPEKVRWLTGTENLYPINSQNVIANVDWIAENPEAANFLRLFKLPIQDFNAGLVEMGKVEKPDDPEFLYSLARAWKQENQSQIDAWVREAKR